MRGYGFALLLFAKFPARTSEQADHSSLVADITYSWTVPTLTRGLHELRMQQALRARARR
ncbi:hypothetical protein ABF87_01065 [Nitrosomonas sp. JL21]|uniref:hypothetical protein n=1 Tax=Nitrosomonas sp. JL21 TaxID=153949 RepID=UPI00136EFE70|nr:hypothetical protein [Nitrosomonas sp. JL21]MCC7090604.1 hypothetical protein [Nitrosomonas sp.]MXS76567.1 hypothetical protein [Nitrosomonas sp. JL21]